MHLAAFNGDLKTLTFLLGEDLDIDAQDENGLTPVMMPFQQKDLAGEPLHRVFRSAGGSGDETLRLKIFEMLIDAGANQAVITSSGMNLLHFLAASGCPLPTYGLLSDHSGINQISEDGNTPLSRAAGGSDSDVVQLLLEHGATADTRALIHAIGNEDSLRFLLESGVDPNGMLGDSITPLTAILSSMGPRHGQGWNEEEIERALSKIRLLLDYGADPLIEVDQGGKAQHNTGVLVTFQLQTVC